MKSTDKYVFGLKDRLRAFGIHLLASALVLLAVCALVAMVWYPGQYLKLQGVLGIILVLVGVDVVLGPLLTFVVYRKGKKSLRFDLSMIVLLQLIALGYGGHVIYKERPYFLVHALDSFHVVTRPEVDMERVQSKGLAAKPFADVAHIVSYMPMGEEFQRFQDSVMFEGAPDLERRPEYWEAYPKTATVVESRAKPLAKLRMARPEHERTLDKAVSKTGLTQDQLLFLPLRGKHTDMAALIETENFQVVGIADVDPWIED